MSPINVLLDEVLLDLFDFYLNMGTPYGKTEIEAWQTLVHVCRRWRSLVLQSPRRLNLRLFCTHRTPARDKLDIWPALPLIIDDNDMTFVSNMGNTIAALGQSNRVVKAVLEYLERWQLEEVLAAMQVPFPGLEDLRLLACDETVPVIPDSFLGGSVQHLRIFELGGIPFTGLILQNLFLPATRLVDLNLYAIPLSWYISPEAIVALLSGLSGLRTFYLGFRYPRYGSGRETPNLPPRKRSILPDLQKFGFNGVTEYLEDLITCIDTPRLNKMYITFYDPIDIDCPQLAQFMYRTPKLGACDLAHVEFTDGTANVALRSKAVVDERLRISMIADRQLSSIEQVCNTITLPLLSMVEDLSINDRWSRPALMDDAIEDTLWLRLFLPFTRVKNIYLCKRFAPGIAVALQELVEGRITEVLPNLQNIFVERLEPSGPFQENIRQFVAARQLSDHNIAISNWVNDFDRDEDSDRVEDSDRDENSDRDEDSDRIEDSDRVEDSDWVEDSDRFEDSDVESM